MSRQIETANARERLKPRREPHWLEIHQGCHLGFRKMTAGSAGTWIAKYRDPDTNRRTSRSLGPLDHIAAGERFREARKLAEQWFQHMGAGGTKDAITVGEACERYVQHLRDSRRVAAAIDAEGRFARWVHSDQAFARVDLLKLSHAKVKAWRTSMSNTPALPQNKKGGAPRKPRSQSAINRDMTSLRAALNHALRERHVTSDAAWSDALRPIRDADKRRTVYLEASERRALVERAPKDLATFLRALSLLPLRPGAVASLTVGDFDKRLGVLTIGKDKNGRPREIGLPDATTAFFAEQAKNKLPGAPLLSQADGRPWDRHAWKKPLKAAARAAGLDAATVAYTFRHSTITDLLTQHKLDTMTVAALAGTSLQMIEKHYGHLVREHAKAALAGLAI